MARAGANTLSDCGQNAHVLASQGGFQVGLVVTAARGCSLMQPPRARFQAPASQALLDTLHGRSPSPQLRRALSTRSHCLYVGGVSFLAAASCFVAPEQLGAPMHACWMMQYSP